MPEIRESAILAGIMAALRWDPRVMVWRQNTGAARLPGRGGKETVVHFGVVGAADISGLVRGSGRRLEIEVKRPGNKPTEQQQRYGRAITEAGGLYILAHSIDEVRAALDAAIGPANPEDR